MEPDPTPDHIDAFVPEIYEELKRLAAVYMRRERRSHTLQTTALVNEAYLRLSKEHPEGWKSPAQFMAIAARAIRQILVRHAHRRNAKKRGGDFERLPLEEASIALGGLDPDILDLDEALEELSRLDPRKAQVVEWRFFAGMTGRQMAEASGRGLTSVEDDWYAAQAWLRARLG